MNYNYLHWDEQIIQDLSEKNISDMYSRGYLFTRIGKGVMHQTRSVRIDLIRFELSSENKRILKKIPGITLNEDPLPLEEYDYKIAKLAKDFYGEKFGPGLMSAQKVKEMLGDRAKSNFNCLLRFDEADKSLGYAICYQNPRMIHYSYPFYSIDDSPKDIGLGMMALAAEYAERNGLKYIYLGSLQRPGDTYKLQFKGLEWFDGGPDGTGEWSADLQKAKFLLSAV